MQINISDSDISGHGASVLNGFHSKKSVDMDSLMGNLTKPATNATSKNSLPEGNPNPTGVKKNDFFGKK
jgi:hypothetical protein